VSANNDAEINSLVEGDWEDWRRLWTGYLEYYESTVTEAVYSSTFQRLLAGNTGAENEFRGKILRTNGKATGLVHFLYHRHCWKIENVCYLQDLFVDPAIRGSGLGRKLIEAVYTDADAEGCPSVYWLTQDFNAAGRRLYDRVGVLTPFIKYTRS